MVVGDIVGVLGFGVLAFAVLGTEFLAQPRCVRLTARGERGGLKLNRLSCAAVLAQQSCIRLAAHGECGGLRHNRLSSAALTE